MSIKKSGITSALAIILAAFLGMQCGSLKAQEIKKVVKQKTTTTTTTIKDKNIPPPPPPPPPAHQKQGKTTKIKDDNGKEAYTWVKVMPQYPGGDDARTKYMMNAIQYPGNAKETGVEGIVNIAFIIEKNGKISNAKVVKGIGSGCDEEALRVVKEMPKWHPGKHKGKPVRVQMVIPIKFTLK